MKFLLFILMLSHSLYADDTEQSVGHFSQGSLEYADELTEENGHVLKLFPARDRAWGNTFLIKAIEEASLALKKFDETSERVQVGDISDYNGGKISRHRSHQNGLDVDIAYLRVNKKEQNINDSRSFTEYFTTNGKLSSNFDVERNWVFIKALNAAAPIELIFVARSIRKAIADFAKSKGEYRANRQLLSRIRYWPKHDDHMHVRFTCPRKDLRCTLTRPSKKKASH